MARTTTGGGRAPFSSAAATSKKAKPTRANRASKNDPSNAYTYIPALPKRHRTSEQQNSLSYEETKAGPSSPRRKSKQIAEEDEEEDDEEVEMEERIRKLQMMIASDNPGEIDEDSEESEVDSDEAWGSEGSDEERWGDVFRDLEKGKSKGKKAKGKEVVLKPAKLMTVDLNETDDEEPVSAKAKKGKSKAVVEEVEEDNEDEDEEGLEESEDEFAVDREQAGLSEDDDEEDEVEDKEDEDEDDEDDEDDEVEDEEDEDEDDEDDEDDDEGSEAELPSDLSDDEPDTLEGLDSFVDELDAADQKKRADKGVKAEVAKTKRRVLPVSGAGQSNGKLDLSTLIASHPSLAGASGLLPSKADNKSSSSILKQGILPAPLPTVVQDRLDREAAYEKTKQEGQKWSGAMKRIKEAEHLQFPLQAKERGGIKSSGEVIGSFKATNQFEDAITSLLKSANLTENEMTKREDEDLQGQELSLEEIKARREALRYQRELMFRAEAKAKRISKIKSKTYRKLARKRAQREGGGEVDLDDLEKIDPEAAAHEREKLERDRARERATLRHGAKSGRWARDAAQGNEGEMEDRRKAREDMLDLKDRLTRKIQGRDEGDSSDEDESEDDDEDEDEDAIREKAFNQLSALDKEAASKAVGGKKGLMEMAFMKKAQDREMRRVAEDEKQARMDIERYGNDRNSDDDSESDDEGNEAVMERVGGNEGRMVFAPSKPGTAPPQAQAQQDPPISAQEPRTKAQPFKSALSDSQPAPESNPWLTSTLTSGPSRKKNTTQATDKASRTLAKSATARENALEDERVDISLDGPVVPNQSRKRKNEDNDEEDGEGMLPNGLKGFKQRDLVAEAFAGDDVVQDFAAEKARQTEADAPKTQDTSLPGWGSWGGKGTKKSRKNSSKKSKFLVQTAGIEPTKRKDFESSNVIISEKKDRKASQFQVKDLPYPYTSVEQYEARFKTPLGSEWNSRSVYQKENMPRVTKKPGAIIEPVRRLF